MKIRHENTNSRKINKNVHWDKLIDGDFDYNKSISILSSKGFEIDRESKIILGVIAKNGPSNESKIASSAYKKNHNITRDIVQNRLIRNKNNLLQLEFVTQRSGKKIKNLNKNERIYLLTLKGLLASLAITPFKFNYMIKTYKKIVKENYPQIVNIDEIAIQAIKYFIAMFLFDQYLKKNYLDKIESLVSVLFEFNDINPYKNESPSLITSDLDDEQVNLLEKIFERFWLTGHMLNKLNYSKENNLMPIYFWYYQIEEFSNTTKSNLKPYKVKSFRLPWNEKEINSKSESILKYVGCSNYNSNYVGIFWE